MSSKRLLLRENYPTNLKIRSVSPTLVFDQMPILVCLFLEGRTTVLIFALQEKDSNFCCINIVEDEK